METKLYTITVFSENTVGLLNQITVIFTRRGLNIETLSVSPSALKGIHKFTITLLSTQDVVEKVVKQIDKRVDILKAYYNTDEDLVHQELALYKLATDKVLEHGWAYGHVAYVIDRETGQRIDDEDDECWGYFDMQLAEEELEAVMLHKALKFTASTVH